MAIQGKAIKRPLIEVYGVTGEFRLASAGSPYRVKYFNTTASTLEDSAAGNARDLLRELRPMRERVDASNLTTLDTLLQRELSDRRVARELIPYLRGDKSRIGFFPAILVVLVPNGFLEVNRDDAQYPTPGEPKEEEGSIRVNYEGHWTVVNYKVDNSLTTLARLGIDHQKTDVIVLDGQHRANAFRYMAGLFEQAEGDTVYAPFYAGVDRPADFRAELPVTIIWFETDGDDIEPIMISKQLFVDVNTNAQPVEKSRRILLDDLALPHLTVSAVYEELAKNAFSPSPLSLLHAAFDVPSAKLPSTSLFSPEMLDYAVRYAAFGRDRYDEIGVRISADHWEQQKQEVRLKRCAEDLTDDLLKNAEAGDRDAIQSVRGKIRETFAVYFLTAYSPHPLVHAHVEACSEIDAWVEAETEDYILRQAWRNIFRGGEGLYAGYADGGGGKAKPSQYRVAIEKIEKEFRRLRAIKAGNVREDLANKGVTTFTSKAGLTGFVMALAYLAREHGWSEELPRRFGEASKRYSAEQWAHMMVDVKELLIGPTGLSPKAWPALRNLILRALEEVNEDWEVFRQERNRQECPEYAIVRRQIRDRFRAHVRATGSQEVEVEVEDEERRRWQDEIVNQLRVAFKAAGIEPIDSSDVLTDQARQELDQALFSHNRKVKGAGSPDDGDEGQATENDEEEEDL